MVSVRVNWLHYFKLVIKTYYPLFHFNTDWNTIFWKNCCLAENFVLEIRFLILHISVKIHLIWTDDNWIKSRNLQFFLKDEKQGKRYYRDPCYLLSQSDSGSVRLWFNSLLANQIRVQPTIWGPEFRYSKLWHFYSESPLGNCPKTLLTFQYSQRGNLQYRYSQRSQERSHSHPLG